MVMGLRPGSKGSSEQLVLLIEVTDGGGRAQGAETKYTLGIKMGDSFVDSVLRAENHLFTKQFQTWSTLQVMLMLLASYFFLM